MKHCFLLSWRIISVAVCLLGAGTRATQGQTTNTWILGYGDFWDVSTNWSLAVGPTNTHALVSVTNAVTKTITIDNFTASIAPETLTISNLFLSGPAGTVNTLLYLGSNPIVPLRIRNSFTISTGGALQILDGAVQVEGVNSGRLVVNGGALLNHTNALLTTTNTMSDIAQNGSGSLTIQAGTWRAGATVVGRESGSQGTLTVAGGTNELALDLRVAGLTGSTGAVWVTGGQLTIANDAVYVGFFGTGQMTVSNGTWRSKSAGVGVVSGSQGTLTVAGGTSEVTSNMVVGDTGKGVVWVTGGQLTVTNNPTYVSFFGSGQMTVSNGTWQARQVYVGFAGGSQGTLTVAGGTNQLSGFLSVGEQAGATGTVWVTGGQLTIPNIETDVGYSGVGRMTVSNGTWRTLQVFVGANPGAQGTLTVSGGTNTMSSTLVVGICGSATGIVNVTGGALYITNANLNAVLDVRGGTFTQSGGLLVVDQIVITNACGRFVHTGGSLAVIAQNLTPTFDADGDGIPNASDLDPFNPADAGTDPDGDGFTNLQEFQAGTNPTNSTSVFRITAITPVTNSLRVTWTTVAGKTNALERTAGIVGNFNTNGFVAIFTVTNTAAGTTNYLDIGAATNVPAFYYRIRLVP